MFYAIALSLAALEPFVAWLTFLIAVDFVWVVISIFIRSERLSVKSDAGEVPLGGWMLLDLVMFAYFLYYFIVRPAPLLEQYYFLFFYSLIRTVIDYFLGRKFYFPE